MKTVKLPIVEPIFGAYHRCGVSSAVIGDNLSIRNWFLNRCISLKCNMRFLSGYTTPNVNVVQSGWTENPHLEKVRYPMRFAKGHINKIIRSLLDDGYYVIFTGVDDFYMQGKTFYNERHFSHDGLICGYDQSRKTYRVFAYDQGWIYREFDVPQKCFDAGRQAMFKKGEYGMVAGIKALPTQVEFEPETVLRKLKEYLSSTFSKNRLTKENEIIGNIVHDYIAIYLDKLADGTIPYERMDWRIFRLIWEHKKLMLERLQKVEQCLSLDHKISDQYQAIVAEADAMRMLYASYHLKRRDRLLKILHEKVISVKNEEQRLLNEMIKKMEEVLGE